MLNEKLTRLTLSLHSFTAKNIILKENVKEQHFSPLYLQFSFML